jgi:aminoglycoside phosphotransferase (APT) family kinase protein
MKPDFARRIERYLDHRLGLRVTSAQQIAGAGLSRSVVRVSTVTSAQQEQLLILLIEDAASPVPPNRQAEYAALCSLSARSDIKVSRAYCVEHDPEPLGHPFIVTELLPGSAHPTLLEDPAYLPHAERIARQGFEILGTLAKIDARSVDLGPSVPVPAAADVARLALAQTERVLQDVGATDSPVAAAALRHLRRTMPPAPPRLSLVHGDYRIGNYLFDTTGVTGIIDWEMVHKGDPLEDLAWAMLPNWEFAARPGRPAGFLTRDEAIAAWESTRGIGVDRTALDWWILFSHLKAFGLWATCRHMFATGKTREIIMALVGAHVWPRQEACMAQILKEQRA